MAVDAPDPTDEDETESEPDIDDVDGTEAIAQKLVDLDPIDAADQTVQDAADQRAWLKAAHEIVAARFERTDPSDRVQFALDMMVVAACERVGRILRSDLGRGK